MIIEVLLILLGVIIICDILAIYFKAMLYAIIGILLTILTVGILFADGVLEVAREYYLGAWVSYTVHAQAVAIAISIFAVIGFIIVMRLSKL